MRVKRKEDSEENGGEGSYFFLVFPCITCCLFLFYNYINDRFVCFLFLQNQKCL